MFQRHGWIQAVAAACVFAGVGCGGGGDDGPCVTLEVTLAQPEVHISEQTSYTAVMHNRCATRTGLVLQGTVVQGTTQRAAGGALLRCPGAADGALPPGTCTMEGMPLSVSDSAAGQGTFTPGAALGMIVLAEGDAPLDIASVNLQLLAEPK